MPLPGESQVGFLGSCHCNGLPHLLGFKTQMVLPHSRRREGRFVQEATAPKDSEGGLGERDRSRAGSHDP